MIRVESAVTEIVDKLWATTGLQTDADAKAVVREILLRMLASGVQTPPGGNETPGAGDGAPIERVEPEAVARMIADAWGSPATGMAYKVLEQEIVDGVRVIKRIRLLSVTTRRGEIRVCPSRSTMVSSSTCGNPQAAPDGSLVFCGCSKGHPGNHAVLSGTQRGFEWSRTENAGGD